MTRNRRRGKSGTIKYIVMVTSTKKVMFSLAFVSLFVLSVTVTKNGIQ